MLNVVSRDLNEKTKSVIKRGYIPAVIHGKGLEKAIPVEVYKTDFKRFLEADGHKGNIELNLNGEVQNCVISEVQIDAVKGTYLHIDFKFC